MHQGHFEALETTPPKALKLGDQQWINGVQQAVSPTEQSGKIDLVTTFNC